MSLFMFSLSVLIFSISFFIISYSSMWILNEIKRNVKQPIDNDSQVNIKSDFNLDDYVSPSIRSYDARIERMKMEMAEENMLYNSENSEDVKPSNGLYVIPDEEVDNYIQSLIDAEDEVSK